MGGLDLIGDVARREDSSLVGGRGEPQNVRLLAALKKRKTLNKLKG